MRRLMLLFLLLLAPELALAQGRTYVPFNPGFTAGSGGSIVVPGPLLLPDGSAAAPSLSFASDTGTNMGIFRLAEGRLAFSPNGSVAAEITSGTIVGYGDIQAGITGQLRLGSDTILTRDAANTLALRNGVNAQTFNVYNTYTDASNYERLTFSFQSNIPTISTAAAGTGTGRNLNIFPSSGSTITYTVQPLTTETYNLGAGSRQWMAVYASGSIQGSKTKALTESSATTVATVAVPQTAAANYGGGSVGYTVYATDGTDSQSLVGDVRFAMVNKAGTESCTIGEIGTPVLAESAGGSTLTCTWTCATAAADTVDLAANCTSSLVQTTFTVESRGNMQKPNTWTPQ